MYSQRIKLDILNHNGPDLFARVGEGSARTIYAVIMSGDESITINNPVICARIVKPDKTFVYTSATVTSEAGEPTEIRFNIPGAASQVSGIGCYDIRIQENGESNIVYTAEGRFVIDDDMITEEMLESVAEVNGLIFPEDFYTKDDNVAIIDDNVTSTEKTWSSSKIAYEIASPDYTNTATGNPIELTDAADAPVVRLETEIQGYQEGSGTPSLTNVRPIVAYTEGEIEVRGKNFFSYYDYPIRNGYWDGQNVFNGNNAEVDIQHASGWQYILIPVEAGKKITASNMLASGGVNNAFLGSDDVTDIISVFRSVDINGTRVVPNGAKYLAYCGNHFDTNYTNYPNAQIEYGTTATTYEPYTSTTHTTTYSTAIYRGSEDVVNGEVTSEWGMIASYAGETLPGEWISDRDEYAPGTTPTTGAQVAYELATPTTSSVTPTNLPIRTLSGYNHIESSTGDMEVEYIKSSAQSLVDLIEAVTR